MPRTWPFLLALIAVVSAFAGTAQAQPNVGECLTECSKRFQGCDQQTPSCAGIPACAGLGDADFAGIKDLCNACRNSDADCADKILPKPNTTPVQKGAPKDPPPPPPPPPAPPLTPEQRCHMRGGVWTEIVTEVDDGEGHVVRTRHMVCKSADEMIKLLLERITVLESRVDGHDAELQKLREELEALKKQQGTNETNPDGGEILRRLEWINGQLQKYEDALKALSDRQDEADRRLRDLERTLNPSRFFALQFSLFGNIHTMRPWSEENTQWAVGPEFQWLPQIVSGLRAVAGIGLSYAGSNDEDDTLKMVNTVLGVQIHAYDMLSVALGFTHERRLDESDTSEDAFYAGYVEPKLCPGDTDHRFCGSIRAALGGTVFTKPSYLIPDSQDSPMYVRFDASFMLLLAYAYLPGDPR